jgi:hypothetical protein
MAQEIEGRVRDDAVVEVIRERDEKPDDSFHAIIPGCGNAKAFVFAV